MPLACSRSSIASCTAGGVAEHSARARQPVLPADGMETDRRHRAPPYTTFPNQPTPRTLTEPPTPHGDSPQNGQHRKEKGRPMATRTAEEIFAHHGEKIRAQTVKDSVHPG